VPRQPTAKSSGSIRAKVNLIKRIKTAVLIGVLLVSVRPQQLSSQTGLGCPSYDERRRSTCFQLVCLKGCRLTLAALDLLATDLRRFTI